MLETFTVSWKQYCTLGLLAMLTACGGAALSSGNATVPESTLIATSSMPTSTTSTPIRIGGTSRPTPSIPPATVNGSGIEGRTVIGPVCPVARVNQPCPDKPYPATITILGVADRRVAQAQSDADGHFRVALPAGTYTLVPLSPGKYPRPPEPQTVMVAATGYVSVTLAYDSGIR